MGGESSLAEGEEEEMRARRQRVCFLSASSLLSEGPDDFALCETCAWGLPSFQSVGHPSLQGRS